MDNNEQAIEALDYICEEIGSVGCDLSEIGKCIKTIRATLELQNSQLQEATEVLNELYKAVRAYGSQGCEYNTAINKVEKFLGLWPNFK